MAGVLRPGQSGLSAAMSLALAVCGCGEAVGGTGDGAAADAAWTQFTLLVFGSYGTPPPGSSCTQETPTTRVVNAATRKMSYSLCAPPEVSAPWSLKSGTQELGARDLADIDRLLTRIAPSDQQLCGADAPVITLDLEAPAGVQHFADDFYAGCPWQVHAGRTFVTGIPELSYRLPIFQIK